MEAIIKLYFICLHKDVIKKGLFLKIPFYMKIILKLESNNVYTPIILGKNSSYRGHFLKLIFSMVKLKTKITQNSLACRNCRKRNISIFPGLTVPE